MKTDPKKILIVVGTRPNFIKVTRFKKMAEKFPKLEIKIVHTGQHFDAKMSDVFFQQFGLVPDFFLHASGGSVVTQMASTIEKLETLLRDEYRADFVLVVGDVNSTLSAAITAVKLNIEVAHIESGLRSFDRSMPEEVNRILTDAVTDYFFVTEKSGTENLLKEGKNQKNIFFVGNTMIDTMVAFDDQIRKSDITEELKVEKKKFVLMTMHRPATVDNEKGLLSLVELINAIPPDYRIIFPVHPRTRSGFISFGLSEKLKAEKRLLLTDPLDYFAFQKLILDAAFIVTDSGGIQEESTFRNVPCLTLRPNTERPVTVSSGTNTLLNFDKSELQNYIRQIESGTYKKGSVPELWDGKSTERILEIINSLP